MGMETNGTANPIVRLPRGLRHSPFGEAVAVEISRRLDYPNVDPMTVTGAIGAICMFPLRAIINTSVALGIHPNVLTLIGVLINVVAAWALAVDSFVLAGVIMIVANIFDFIDGKVAHITGKQ